MFTDIGASTRKWESNDRAMAAAVVRHDEILRSTIEQHGGYVFKTVGDAFCATFPRAADALRCAIAVQRAIASEPWTVEGGIEVRIGLHTGDEYEVREGDYYGRSVNRAARLGSIVNPRQIILDVTTLELARSAMTDREQVIDQGTHRLKDLDMPMHVMEVRLEEEADTTFASLSSLDRTETNLPLAPRPIVGRAKAIADVHAALARSNVVTILGAAGIGKTRVALEAAAELAERFPDGCRFIDFRREPGSPVLSVIRAGLLPHGDTIALDDLVERVRNRRQLVVIDDADDGFAEIAAIVSRLAARAGGMRFIITSRRPLPIENARVVRLGRLEARDATTLLIDQLASHGLTKPDRDLVASLAEAVDGIPLALEVIAGSAQSLPLENIRAMISGRTGTGDHPMDVLDRTIKTATEVLSEQDQRIFSIAASFAGGWTLEALTGIAESIGIPAQQAFASSSVLVAASLIELDTSRYLMLAPIRSYAAALADAPERTTIGTAHADYFAQYAAQAARELPRATRAKRQGIFAERANMRSALRTLLERDRPADALALVLDLATIWYRAADFDDGLRLVSDVHESIATTLGDVARARLSVAASAMAQHAGMLDVAAAHAKLARSHAAASADEHALAESDLAAATVARFEGQPAEAESGYERCVERFQRLGLTEGVARAQFNLASLYESRGESDRARAMFEQSLNGFELAKDDYRVAWCLYGLASVALQQDDREAARVWLDESMELRRDLDDRRGIAECLLLEAQLSADSDPAHTLTILPEAIGYAEQSADRFGLAVGARLAASALAGMDRYADAAAILGMAITLAQEAGLDQIDPNDTTIARTESCLIEKLGAAQVSVAKRRGGRERDQLAARLRAIVATSTPPLATT